MKQGNPDKALKLLQRAIKVRDDIRIAHADVGAVYMERNQNSQAIAVLKRAIEIEPGHPDAHYRLGRLYKATGNAAAARQEFAKVRGLQKKGYQDTLQRLTRYAPTLHPERKEQKPAKWPTVQARGLL